MGSKRVKVEDFGIYDIKNRTKEEMKKEGSTPSKW
jgi:hypothetical protein